MWYQVVPRINKHVLKQKLFRWEWERHEITALAGTTPNIKTRRATKPDNVTYSCLRILFNMVSQILSLAFQLSNYTNNLLFLWCFFFFICFLQMCIDCVGSYWVKRRICVVPRDLSWRSHCLCLYRLTMSLVLESAPRCRPRPCFSSACCSRVLFPVFVCCGLAPLRCHLAKSALPSGIMPCFPVIETCGRVRIYEAAVQ